MKAKKATANLNTHNQRLYVSWSCVKLLDLFLQQQQDAIDAGIIERRIPLGQLRQFAQRCEASIRSEIAYVDTVDKAKKMQAKLKRQFTTDTFFFARCLESGAPTFSVLDRIAYLQAKPTTVQPQSKSRTRLMSNEESVKAKKMMLEQLGVVGRSWVDPRLVPEASIVLGWHAVKNASVKIHNTERETRLARAMMQRLAGQGYERVLDGCDTVRMQHVKDGALAFVFARDGLFVRAFLETLQATY